MNPEVSTKRVGEHELSDALQQTLSRYVFTLSNAVNEATAEAMQELVVLTKRTAPRRKGANGIYHRYIDSRQIPGHVGYSAYQWYVKAPHYRLTHLLEDGHWIISHGRFTGQYAHGTHFVRKATEKVFVAYENRLQQIIEQSGK